MAEKAEQKDLVLSEQEMVSFLTSQFPQGNFKMLGLVGLTEAVRISRGLNEMGLLLQIDLTLVLSYALAFQRWTEASAELNKLTTPYVVGSNGFMQTHPAMTNEQKYFSILRASTRILLNEIREQFPGEAPDKDDLDQFLNQKGKDSDD